jgi:hypothetical protein
VYLALVVCAWGSELLRADGTLQRATPRNVRRTSARMFHTSDRGAIILETLSIAVRRGET